MSDLQNRRPSTSRYEHLEYLYNALFEAEMKG